MPEQEVKALLAHQLKAGEPARAPWYRGPGQKRPSKRSILKPVAHQVECHAWGRVVSAVQLPHNWLIDLPRPTTSIQTVLLFILHHSSRCHKCWGASVDARHPTMCPPCNL